MPHPLIFAFLTFSYANLVVYASLLQKSKEANWEDRQGTLFFSISIAEISELYRSSNKWRTVPEGVARFAFLLLHVLT